MTLTIKKKYGAGDVILHFFTNKKYRIFRHLFLFVFLAASIWSSNPLSEPLNTYVHILLFALVLFLFYFNSYYLVPQYLFRDNFLGYCLRILGILLIEALFFGIVKYALSPYFNLNFKNLVKDINLFGVVFIVAILIASSTTIKLFQRWISATKRITELESITLNAELEQLKNQINPHFLFNALNNINVLTKKDPKKASQVLMKLSDLLRYQLYDSTRNNVLLTAEIKFLKDFLNLEKIRRDDFELTLSQRGELSGIQVAPLLFIIFVENAIKHNMDSEKQSFVHLNFDVHNNDLLFKCVNSKPTIAVVNSGSGGLGLVNVKRRLELLYPQKHDLNIVDDHDSFTVNLKIAL